MGDVMHEGGSVRTGLLTWPKPGGQRPGESGLGPLVRRRAAGHRDTAFLQSLFADSRDDLLVLPPDSRDLIIDMQFRTQRRRHEVEYPAARHDVLVVRDAPIGHLATDLDTRTLRVVDLCVRSGYRGQGIGSSVLAQLTLEADLTCCTIRAQVWSANVGAQRFFLRHGFVVGQSVAGYTDVFRRPR